QLHAQSDASFRAVLDRMPDLLAVLRGGKLTYLNRATSRFLGFGQRDRWDDVELEQLVHPDDRTQLGELIRKVSSADATITAEVLEIRMRGADGSWRICEVSGVLVELGGASTVVMSGRDVTERKRMRAKLMVSDRMASLGTLAAGIAHEINNPLAYVTGNLEAIAEAFQASQHQPSKAECLEMSAAIDDARDGAERVRQIV